MRLIEKIFYIEKNPKKKDDFVNSQGINVSRLYREIDLETPRKIEELKKSDYSFTFERKYDCGGFGNFYALSRDVGAKFIKSLRSGHGMERGFNEIRDEFIHYDLAEKLENNILPEKYGLFLVHEKTLDKLFPLLLVRNLKNKNLENDIVEKSLSKTDYNLAIDYFKKKKFRMEKHLVSDGFSDIDPHNAIFVPEERELYLIDPAQWKFKGVHDLD